MVGKEYYEQDMAAYLASIETKEPKMTFEEKIQKIRELNNEVNRVMHTEISDKCCRTCEHFRNGCCAARNMAKVPPEVVQRAYGCKKWYEKDYIPF